MSFVNYTTWASSMPQLCCKVVHNVFNVLFLFEAEYGDHSNVAPISNHSERV